MDNILAKRYAKALLSLGQEDGQYVVYGQELSQFGEALAGSTPASSDLFSPAYPREIQGRVLDQILKASAFKPVVENFLRLLHDKGRLILVSGIISSYNLLVDEIEGLVRGTLTTATPLEPQDLLAIKGALGIFAGRKVELVVSEDPSIIGGLVAKLGDLVIDGSLRTQIEKLGSVLSSS